MVAHSAGERFEGLTDAQGRPAASADRSAGAMFRLHRGIPRPGPGSWGLMAGALTRPSRRSLSGVACGALPAGLVSTEPLRRRSGASPLPNGRARGICGSSPVTTQTDAGPCFGRPDAPPAELANAVAASCAIPGFYRPVDIAGRRYVDGGVWSTSNLDVLGREEPDVVICLNPTSTLHPARAGSLGDRLAKAMGSNAGRMLGREARRLRQSGIPVVIVQPTREDLAVMGPNLMSRRNRHEVIETAMRTVAEQLDDPVHADVLARLPPGAPEKIRRPAGPPTGWPAQLGGPWGRAALA